MRNSTAEIFCSLFLRLYAAEISGSTNNRIIRTMDLGYWITYPGLVQDFDEKPRTGLDYWAPCSVSRILIVLSRRSRLELTSFPMHLHRQRNAPLNGSLHTDDCIRPFSPNAAGQFVTSCLPRGRLSSYEMVVAHGDYSPSACLLGKS